MILDAAQRIVEQGGVGELSAREIGRAIGYAAGTLYNMYDNLDEILLRVEVRVLERLDQQLAADTEGLVGAEAIRGFATSYVAFAHKNPCLWRLLSEHNLPKGVSAPSWYASAVAAPALRLHEPLSNLMRISDSTTIARTARAVWSAIHGMTVLSTDTKIGAEEVDNVMQRVVDFIDLYVAGLAARHGKRNEPSRAYQDRPSLPR